MYSTFNKDVEALTDSKEATSSYPEQSIKDPSADTTSEAEARPEFWSFRSLFERRRMSWSPPTSELSSPSQTATQNTSDTAREGEDVPATQNRRLLADDAKHAELPEISPSNITSIEGRGKAENLDMPRVERITETPTVVDSNGEDVAGMGIAKKPRSQTDRRSRASKSPGLRITKHLTGDPHPVAKGHLGSKPTVQPLPPWKIAKQPEPLTSRYGAVPPTSISRAQRASAVKKMGDFPADLAHEAAAVSSSHHLDQTPVSGSSPTPTLTHLNTSGEAHMVDVGQKLPTKRLASACGIVRFTNNEAYRLILENSNKKGDVLGVSRIAGIMAAKRCSDIVPLCHPIPITSIEVKVEAHPASKSLKKHSQDVRIHNRHGHVLVTATVETHGKTGVEMEALSAVMGACLSVYDMCKAVDKAMDIVGVHLLEKTGGKSDFHYQSWKRSLSQSSEGEGD